MAQKDRDSIRKLREEANRIRREEEARRRRRRMLTQIGIVAGAVVVVAAIVAAVVWLPKAFGSGEGAAEPSVADGSTQVFAADGSETSVPISASGSGVVVGDPDAASKVDVWFDFSCPHCVDFHTATGSELEALIAEGTAQVTFHPIQIVQQYGINAGNAWLATVQYQPELAFAVMDAIYGADATEQANWGDSDYAELLRTTGVTNDQAIQAAEKGVYSRYVRQATDNRDADVTATPTVKINGTIADLTAVGTADGLRSAVETAAGGGASTTAPSAEPSSDADAAGN